MARTNNKGFKGLSGFAMMHPEFPVKKFLNCHPSDMTKPGTSILWGYFGKKWNCVEAFIEKFQDTPHLLEFHLCFRNPDPKMANSMARIQRKMDKIATPNTEVIICPILEDNIRGHDEWYYWAKKVKTKTDYTLVRCPMYSNVRGGYYLERHTINPTYWKAPGHCIANPDGNSVDFKDDTYYFKTHSVRTLKKYFQDRKNFKLRQIWYAPAQGMDGCTGWGGQGVPAPPYRDYKITKKAVKGCRSILSMVG